MKSLLVILCFSMGLSTTLSAQLNSEYQGGTISLVKKGEAPKKRYMKLSDDDKEFLAACASGDLEKVKKADSLGLNIEIYNESGGTPILLASEKGSLGIVKLLIEKKANVNARNIYGYNSIILAADRGHIEIVKLLIENKAELNAEAEEGGVTALLRAVINNNYEMAEILLKAGANPNIKTLNPATPTILKNAWSKEMKKLLKSYKAK